jgi:hypothetical protein
MSSDLGVFGRAAKASARELMARGLTGVVASDAHDCKLRPPSLRGSYSLLADQWGEGRVRPRCSWTTPAASCGRDDFEFPATAPKRGAVASILELEHPPKFCSQRTANCPRIALL